jgi:hypothetical protein
MGHSRREYQGYWRRGRAGGAGAVAVILFSYFIIFFSPVWMVLFFCQRVLISPIFIKSLIKFAICTILICSAISMGCIYYKFLSWDDIFHALDDRPYWVEVHAKASGTHFFTKALTYLIVGWAVVIPIALFHLLLSSFSKYSEGAGYGLLNLHCSITGKKPSQKLTIFQDLLCGVPVIHYALSTRTIFPAIVYFLFFWFPLYVLDRTIDS